MRANEEDGFFVGRSQIAVAVSVVIHRRQGQAGEEVHAPVGTSFAIFQSVVVRGDKF